MCGHGSESLFTNALVGDVILDATCMEYYVIIHYHVAEAPADHLGVVN